MITHESAFESNIEAHLLDHGWSKVAPAGYDRKLGLFPDEVVSFVQASQPKAWQQWCPVMVGRRWRGTSSSGWWPTRSITAGRSVCCGIK